MICNLGEPMSLRHPVPVIGDVILAGIHMCVNVYARLVYFSLIL